MAKRAPNHSATLHEVLSDAYTQIENMGDSSQGLEPQMATERNMRVILGGLVRAVHTTARSLFVALAGKRPSLISPAASWVTSFSKPPSRLRCSS